MPVIFHCERVALPQEEQLVKHWSNTGQTRVEVHCERVAVPQEEQLAEGRMEDLMVRDRSNTGRMLVKYLSNAGQLLVKYWSNAAVD